MKNGKLTACTVAIVLVLSACSGNTTASDGDEPTPPPTSSTPTSLAPTETPSIPDEPVAHMPSIVESETLYLPEHPAGGANAAPDAPGTTNPLYDASQTAYDTFIAWYVYETTTTEDHGGKNGDAIYADGVAMCGKLRLGEAPQELMQDAKNIKGYSGTGAAALYKAASFALCPWHYEGYQTAFDRNVTAMMRGVNTLIQWTPQPPQFYEYGYFAREVCTYMRFHGTEGLEEHLIGLTGKYHEMNLLAYTHGDVQQRKILVHQAVLHTCPGYTQSLGGYWTMY